MVVKQVCVAKMAVRYAALCASRKVHVCHCNSLGGATLRSVTIDNGTDGQTDRVRRNMRPPPREEGRIISNRLTNHSVMVAQSHYITLRYS